jgi:serine/threonine protein kinase
MQDDPTDYNVLTHHCNDREPRGDDREQLIAAAVADFLDRQSAGEALEPDSFCRRYSELLPELRAQIDTILHIDTLLGCGDEALTQPMPASRSGQFVEPDLPERLSGKRLLADIGSGGMGRVVLGIDERLDRKVAIKVLGSRYWGDRHLRERFMQEARALAALSHPNIVGIHSLGGADEPPHFVMEYVQGVSLTEAASPLSLTQKVELMRKVALAVEVLHQHGIVHRDLKPGNILVGANQEPKVLDFGLALRAGDRDARLTRPGEVMGTVDYFSPEQARGDASLDARSDVFSLGAILYEVLAGHPPFRGETFQEQIRCLSEQDPVVPRRIDPHIPGELQNICLKALEKAPENRYGSAREMAADFERFLAGEPVLAAPTSYSRLVAGKVEQHLGELRGWTSESILSELEFDSFRKLYESLIEREDAWIMAVRRLSFSQVSLYLGAWVLVLGAALVVLFEYRSFAGTPPVVVIGAATLSTGYFGVRCWRQGQRRIGVAYLLAFCLLLPIMLTVGMSQFQILEAPSRGNERLEFLPRFESFRRTTNAQLWWALLLSLPAYLRLRVFTRSFVFSLVIAVIGALLCLVTLLRMGLLEWLDSDPGRVYLWFLQFAALFFTLGISIERLRHPADSQYFYFIGLAFIFAGLSGVALFHEPYANWLKSVAPRTRGQQEYLFIINAGIYLALQYVCDRFPSTQTRWVGKTFRFVIPGHILTSLLLLGLAAESLWHESPADSALLHETRFFEILLPIAACGFVFGSIKKQMKNYLAAGLLFLAIGVIRLQQELFRDKAAWPIILLVMGFLLMILAVNYPGLKIAIVRLGRRNRQ